MQKMLVPKDRGMQVDKAIDITEAGKKRDGIHLSTHAPKPLGYK